MQIREFLQIVGFITYKDYNSEINNTLDNERKDKEYRNKLCNLLKHAKKSYFSHILKLYKNNTKQTWSVKNSLLNKPTKYLPEYVFNGTEKVCDPHNI